jgi:general stress protein 26
MDQDLKNKINNLFENVPYLTIASITTDGSPWNSPVFGIHDDEYNFIWNSSTESQHSKNISEDKNIFIVIYNSMAKAGDGFGLYIQAEAEQLEESDLEQVLPFWYEKIHKTPKSVSEFLNSGSQRLYKAIPKKVWVNAYDKNRSPADYKIEVDLKDLK